MRYCVEGVWSGVSTQLVRVLRGLVLRYCVDGVWSGVSTQLWWHLWFISMGRLFNNISIRRLIVVVRYCVECMWSGVRAWLWWRPWFISHSMLGLMGAYADY